MSLLKLWFIRNPVLVSYSIFLRQGSSNLSGSQSALTCPCVCARAQLGLREFNKRPIAWNRVDVDLIGPLTVKTPSGKKELLALTMIDPSTGWFEVKDVEDKSAKE
jgi:hypothetical protein